MLDETLVMHELSELCESGDVNSFLRGCLFGQDVFCVSAQFLLASANAKQQTTHRDHPHGYHQYASLVFTLDERPVDTLVQREDGSLQPAQCQTLLFDTHHPHAGPAGSSQNKVFLGFSNPALPDYRSIAREHGHGKKRRYPRLTERGRDSQRRPARPPAPEGRPASAGATRLDASLVHTPSTM